jgi:Flp pilus assembly protein TadG
MQHLSTRRRLLSEAGSVTAEFAISLPVMMSVLLVLLSTFSIQLQRFDLAEQSAMLARAAARGEETQVLDQLAVGPTSYEIYKLANLVCAKAERPVRLLNLSAPMFMLTDRHCARAEGL